jgi:hypothetical protein
MKRPRTWLRVVLLLGLLLVVVQYLALTRLVPRYVLGIVQRAAGGEIAVDRAQLSFPLTTTLTGLRLVSNTPQAAVAIQQAVIVPRWHVSVPSKTLWLERITINRPALRLTRTTAGTLLWPALPQAAGAASAGPAQTSSVMGRPLPSSWKIYVESLQVLDGVVEIVDERSSKVFRGMLDHVSFDLGPVTIPLESSPQLTVAVRAKVIGDVGRAAPLYCSGWVDIAERDLQVSCKLDPLPLAAFEPYIRGAPEVRVYETTLAFTSQWSARANALLGRIQLELANLHEGGLSVGGRTIVDVKKLPTGSGRRLTAEISMSGPLDDPHRWRAEFLPGNEPVQELVDRLMEHGVQVVRLPLWTGHLPMSVVPASHATMTGIEAAAKEIREALEILAVPMPEALPPTGPEAVVATTPAEPAVPSPAMGDAAPSTAVPAGPPAAPPAVQSSTAPTAPAPAPPTTPPVATAVEPLSESPPEPLPSGSTVAP